MFRLKSNSAKSSSKSSPGHVSAAERHKAAREQALRIKALQEQALASLPLRKLHIVLYIRNDPPLANDFHSAFYYHKSPLGGTKYHMKNMGSGWIADHASNGGLFKSQFLCVVIQIGSIPASQEAALDRIMRSFDTSANRTPGFTCRVWVLKVALLLIEAGMLRCSNLEALQQECFEFGNACMIAASRNEQPRPVEISRLCS